MNFPKNITLLGDIHGNWPILKNYCKAYTDSTVLGIGDVGLGFLGSKDPTLPDNFRFFRGNHDNPIVCRDNPAYTVEYGIWNDMFIVAGAHSIDRNYRTPFVDWWPDEELSDAEMANALDAYKQAKPTFVVTHEAPLTMHAIHVAASVTHDPRRGQWGGVKGNRTASLLDEMLKYHRPRYWFHGHWHNPLTYRLHNTTFVCLGINGIFELTEENLKTLDRI